MTHKAARRAVVGSPQHCRCGCWRRSFELVGTAVLVLLQLALVPARPCSLFSLHRSTMSLEKHYLNRARFTITVVAVSNSMGLDTLRILGNRLEVDNKEVSRTRCSTYEEAVSSLEWAISEGKKRVYVHCTAGIGRALRVAIAYLF